MNSDVASIDRQRDEMFRRASDNFNDEREDNSIQNAPRGAQIVQTNQLSTWALVTVLIALFVSAAISASAMGIAFNANYAAQIAEREARLSQNRVDSMEVDLKVTRGLLENKGMKLPEEHKR